MKTVLFIVANQDFQDFEYRIPREIIENEWFEINVAAENKWTCIGVFWHETTATISLKDVDWKDYDAIVFVWGGWALKQYKDHKDYLRIAWEAKILAAICIAPSIISDSWIFEDRYVTGRDDENETWKNYIENNWAFFKKQNIVVDDNIITANWPQSAEAFAREIVSKLRQ